MNGYNVHALKDCILYRHKFSPNQSIESMQLQVKNQWVGFGGCNSIYPSILLPQANSKMCLWKSKRPRIVKEK